MNDEERIEQNNKSYEVLLEEMRTFLSSVEGSCFNICAKLYEIIQCGDIVSQPLLFEQAIILYEDIESNEVFEVPVSQYEKSRSTLREQYGDLVNSFIDFFLQQKYSCEDFYKYMWSSLQNETFFPDEAAKIFAFYYVLIDRRMPYFELVQGYMMTNESFELLFKKHANTLRKIRHITSTEMKQKTERASLVLKELGIDIPDSTATVEQVNEYERQLIIMVELLKKDKNTVTPSIEEILSRLQDRISE